MKINLPERVSFNPGNIVHNPTKERFSKTQQFHIIDGVPCENLTLLK